MMKKLNKSSYWWLVLRPLILIAVTVYFLLSQENSSNSGVADLYNLLTFIKP